MKFSNISLLIILSISLFSFTGALSVRADEGRASQVIVAGVFAETGVAKDNNLMTLNAAKLAIADLNARGGLLGRRVELHLLDNKSTEKGSKDAAQQAVELDALAVIGPAWSAHALAAAPILQKHQIPMIATSATAPQVTQVGDYIFRVCYTDSFQGLAMSAFALRELEARTAALLTIKNDAYSASMGDAFASVFTKGGGAVTLMEEYALHEEDFTSIISQLLQKTPDIVFMPGFSLDGGRFIQQADDMGLKTIYLGGDGWARLSHHYSGASECYYPSHWNANTPSELSRRFQNLFHEQYGPGSIVSSGIPLTFDAIALLEDAVKRAGSFDRPTIRDALADTTRFKTITGEITFSKTGDPMSKPAVIMTYKNQNKVYKTTIFP